MNVVCNSTPLILLAKLSDTRLLKTLYQKVFISQEVYNEVVTKGKGKAGEKELREAQGDWVIIKIVSNKAKIKELEEA